MTSPPSEAPRPGLLRSLTSTEARRRMVVVAASTLPFMLFVSGADVVLPLWVTRDLGLSG